MAPEMQMNGSRIWGIDSANFYANASSTAPTFGGSEAIQYAASDPPRCAQNHHTYKPQFAAASSLILKRIHGNEGRLVQNDESNHESQRQRYVGSTLSLPNGITNETASPESQEDFIATISARMKLKQLSDTDVPDFTQSTISFPASISPSRMPGLRAAVPESGNSPPGHNANDDSNGLNRTGITSNEDIRHQRISSIADGVVPAKLELVGFYGGNTLDSERTEYFMAKKRTDLLNILSFCDQIRPQLLADILVSVSKKHPDLPMFDSPNWSNSHQIASGMGKSSIIAASRAIGRPRHGHTLLNPKLRQRQKNAKRALKRLISARAERVNPEEEEEEEVEDDPVPPTWPKAGEGLYSKIPPETEDRGFLGDDSDGTSFSHFFIDKLGNALPVSSCA